MNLFFQIQIHLIQIKSNKHILTNAATPSYTGDGNGENPMAVIKDPDSHVILFQA